MLDVVEPQIEVVVDREHGGTSASVTTSARMFTMRVANEPCITRRLVHALSFVGMWKMVLCVVSTKRMPWV